MSTPQLRGLLRVALWDFERGSLAYDLMWLAILAFVLCVPGQWLADPMAWAL